MKGLIKYLFVIAVAASCTGPSDFESFESMPSDNWNRFKPVMIEYEALDIDNSYDISIVVRYNKNFKHRRLNVMGTIYTPAGEERYREYYFDMNDADGMPASSLIEDESGAYYESVRMIFKNYSFTEKGIYRFEIENLMSKYDNPGIYKVGIRILPSE